MIIKFTGAQTSFNPSAREGLAFISIGVSTKPPRNIALPRLKKFPSPPLDRCAPQHLFPIASASQYGHYYLQTYFKIAG